MLVSSLPMESRKRMAGDLFSTLAKQSGFLYDVTDTECLRTK